MIEHQRRVRGAFADPTAVHHTAGSPWLGVSTDEVWVMGPLSGGPLPLWVNLGQRGRVPKGSWHVR